MFLLYLMIFDSFPILFMNYFISIIAHLILNVISMSLLNSMVFTQEEDIVLEKEEWEMWGGRIYWGKQKEEGKTRNRTQKEENKKEKEA